MSKPFLFLVLLVPLFSFVCITKKMRQNTIEVTNELPVNVYAVQGFEYPDTTLFFTDKAIILANDSTYFINTSGQKKLFYRDFCNIKTWNNLMKTDTLQIFVFDETTIKGKTWEDISINKLYLRRLRYTYNDIISAG